MALIMALLVPVTANGLEMTYELDFEFSGATPPAGSTPWVTATFDDSFGGADTVRLTMSAGNLVNQEFVDDWLFNFDPALDPTQLTFSVVDSSASVPNVISTGMDAFKADGDGWYDISFDFPPPPGTFPSKFTAGETVVYDITYTSPIDASLFDFYSSPGGGQGIYKTAAHIQGIGPGGNESGWIAPSNSVPEPSALILIGSLLIGFGVIKRKS